MRLLANENFPVRSIQALRSLGYEVIAIIEDSPGAPDHEILDRAAREDLIILTFDRDYGELIYRERLPTPVGIIYFRLDPITPEEPAELFTDVIDSSGLELLGNFTVVERGRVRQRRLP